MKISFFVIFAIYLASSVGNSLSNPVAGPQVADHQVADHQAADPQVASPQVAVQQEKTTKFIDHYAAGLFNFLF